MGPAKEMGTGLTATVSKRGRNYWRNFDVESSASPQIAYNNGSRSSDGFHTNDGFQPNRESRRVPFFYY